MIFQRGRLNHQPVMDDHMGSCPPGFRENHPQYHSTWRIRGFLQRFFFLRIDRFFFLGKTKNRRPVFAFHPLAGRNNGLENMSSISGWIPKIWDIWVCLKMSQPISIQSIPCVSAFPLWKEISACYDCYVVPIPHFQTHQDV